MFRTRVKICCISSRDEALLALHAGADALGLVGPMPSGAGIITDDLAREIAAIVPPPVASFLLTSRVKGADIADHVKYCGTSTVQIVSHIDPGEYEPLIRAAPAIRRVQVIHVEGDDALDLVREYEPYVHAFLLDSGRPNAPVVELGGTGRTHDWQISARIVRSTNTPVFLAGGLKPDNVFQAIEEVRPYGVDLCSCIRTDGRLDAEKLLAFMSEVRRSNAGRGG